MKVQILQRSQFFLKESGVRPQENVRTGSWMPKLIHLQNLIKVKPQEIIFILNKMSIHIEDFLVWLRGLTENIMNKVVACQCQ